MLAVHSGYLTWRAIGDPQLRSFLMALAIASAACAVAVWTSDRWLRSRRREGSGTAAAADVLATPIVAAGGVLVLVMLLAVAFAWFGGQIWR